MSRQTKASDKKLSIKKYFRKKIKFRQKEIFKKKKLNRNKNLDKKTF